MNGKKAECRTEAGEFHPVVDRNRCEGKAACVEVCPYGVFIMGKLPVELRRGLTLRGKVKGYVHKWRQSIATGAGDCHACGLCVEACPEQAIKLARREVSAEA